jgi:predicted MFS family arabinose efflux permease
MNTSAGIGGAVAGLVVAEASYGWLNFTAACLLIPLAALALFTRSRKTPVSDGPRRVAGRPSR